MSNGDNTRTKSGPAAWLATLFQGGILAAACTGTVFAVRSVDRLDAVVQREDRRDISLNNLALAVTSLQQTVDKLADAPEFRVWIANLGRMNPTINLPPFEGTFHDDGRRK